MKAICADGTEIECENFKAIDSGVLLTKDRKRNKVIGFVPNDDLRYVVPEDAQTEHERDVEARTGRRERSEADRGLSERKREGEREEIAALRGRLDRLEARVELSATDHAERTGRSMSTATTENRGRDIGEGRGSESETDDRLDALDAAEAVAEGTRAEPTPDSETELLPGSGDGESDEKNRNESERGTSRNRTPASTTESNAGTDADTETETGTGTERIGTSGFDPVAVVAEQREREGRSHRPERSEGEAGADTGTIDIGRSDPVATIARRGEKSMAGKDDEDDQDEAGSPVPGTEGDDRGKGRDPEAELQRVDGLGPTYADRLTGTGIETLADLEEATSEDVASIAEVSESRAEEWIEQAGELPA